VLRYRAL